MDALSYYLFTVNLNEIENTCLSDSSLETNVSCIKFADIHEQVRAFYIKIFHIINYAIII